MSPRARVAIQSPDQPVPVLLASPYNDDHFALPEILKHPHWEWHKTESCQQALELLKAKRPAVLICERDQPDGHWKDLLEGCQGLAAPANLIVCSRQADEYLWAEVLNLGGYDVLIKPFDREEVLRVAFLAWSSWKRQNGCVPLRKPAGPITLSAAARFEVA